MVLLASNSGARLGSNFWEERRLLLVAHGISQESLVLSCPVPSVHDTRANLTNLGAHCGYSIQPLSTPGRWLTPTSSFASLPSAIRFLSTHRC